MHDPLSVREIIRRCLLVIGMGPRGLDLFFQKLSLDTDSFWSTFGAVSGNATAWNRRRRPLKGERLHAIANAESLKTPAGEQLL
jgi:hypothetical protein